MRVLVEAYGENVHSGAVVHTNSAYLTFVALDDDGRPAPVPPLIPETDGERELYKREEERRLRRKMSLTEGAR